MKYPRVRDVLNRIKWMDTIGVPKMEFLTLVVKDRVSGSKEISGADIVRLGRREFDVRTDESMATIPYYKVTEIWYVKGTPHGSIIWKRPEKTA